MKKKGSFFGFFRKRKETCESFDKIGTKRIDLPTFVVGWKICALKNFFIFNLVNLKKKKKLGR
jgi:hypothetical protein